MRLHQTVRAAIRDRVDSAEEVDDGGASHSAHDSGSKAPDGDEKRQMIGVFLFLKAKSRDHRERKMTVKISLRSKIINISS